ncbi:MAG: hypothetical protein N2748_03800, partial [candidate division WOR-3 bacterium]|nr:hypothetical protein [candidate division WOR-3 bacterium]
MTVFSFVFARLLRRFAPRNDIHPFCLCERKRSNLKPTGLCERKRSNLIFYQPWRLLRRVAPRNDIHHFVFASASEAISFFT